VQRTYVRAVPSPRHPRFAENLRPQCKRPPTARQYLAAASDAQGNIYAIGGLGFNGVPVSAVEKYTPAVTIYTFIKN
jgi:hypothetical protein